MKITKLETFLVKPRWLFLKVHTDEGIVGLGEPILEGRALTCQTAVKELEPWLIGALVWSSVMSWTFCKPFTSPSLIVAFSRPSG